MNCLREEMHLKNRNYIKNFSYLVFISILFYAEQNYWKIITCKRNERLCLA